MRVKSPNSVTLRTSMPYFLKSGSKLHILVKVYKRFEENQTYFNQHQIIGEMNHHSLTICICILTIERFGKII